MTKKREPSRRPNDRKPSLGGNLVWSLLAVGVAGLFAISLVGTTPELRISYSDLQKLVRATSATGQDRFLTVTPGDDPSRALPGTILRGRLRSATSVM